MMRILALGAAGFATLAGCTTNEPDDAGSAPDSAVKALGHVHGLGTDPADGTLYVATHFGVLRVSDDGSLNRVADRWQDTMAFMIAGPVHFLASGHPDLREDLPSHLGLIESHDTAESWSQLPLAGKADFHALDLTGARDYGYDALSGPLLTSTDRTRWAVVTRRRWSIWLRTPATRIGGLPPLATAYWPSTTGWEAGPLRLNRHRRLF